MKRITAIEDDIATLQPKFELGTQDWTRDEKLCIESAYFAITKVTTSKGRTVDIGCANCVTSAAQIVKNYVALVATREAAENETKTLRVRPPGHNWKDTHKTIDAEAKRVGCEFPEEMTLKGDKITHLEAFIVGHPYSDEEDLDGEDLDGEDLDGEDVDGEDVDGEDVDGEDVDGEDVDGEDVDGEDVDGEDVDGEDQDPDVTDEDIL